ncbi:hypothetical protein FN846DRAFT_888463 [Sphaerosporella brunnea]|uniref:Uncharacterized protein n=1 Tax=Sphaerosporella brunnea TaxID=1250544 RepID=A0A5J5F310_9PEZI|nr:hypothetical protein FN846DRAFT_888463 [Sphaerosporella brunnea]
MSTVHPNTQLQHALDEYSLAVQKYGLVVQELPASQRPAPLEKFRYRGNVHAIKRRTAEVPKATQRLLKTALRAAPHEVEEPKEKDAAKARDCGYQKDAVVSTISGASPSRDRESVDGHAANDMHVAVRQLRVPDNSGQVNQVQVTDGQATPPGFAPDPHSSADTGARISTDDTSLLFTNHEVDLLIWVAAASPDAARICARRITQLKTHGASACDIDEVLHTVIRWVEGAQVGTRGSVGGSVQEEK